MTTIRDNAAVLATITPVAAMLSWFGNVLKGWPKQAGSKPTDAMLMVPVLLGKRPGVEALHIAMCLRPEGCTVQQFMLAGSCGPANNYRRALVKTGWFTLTVEGNPYAYSMFITDKGKAKLAKAAEALAAEQAAASEVKAVAKATKKAKGKKARKAPAKPASDPVTTPATQAAQGETPASDQPNANETAAGEAMAAQAGDPPQVTA